MFYAIGTVVICETNIWKLCVEALMLVRGEGRSVGQLEGGGRWNFKSICSKGIYQLRRWFV